MKKELPGTEARGAGARARETVRHWRSKDIVRNVLGAPTVVELAARRLAVCRVHPDEECTEACPLHRLRRDGKTCRESVLDAWTEARL